MLTASSISSTSAHERRDIRSNSQPFKRDKDHRSKWADGVRPGTGVRIDWNATTPHWSGELNAGPESQKAKVRPRKAVSQTCSDYKNHANKTPKPSQGSSWDYSRPAHRIAVQTDAYFECRADNSEDNSLSKSLLELLPSHSNNQSSSPTLLPKDSEILYSFDNKGPSPGDKGRKVDLGGLVEKAEKRWVSEQTERMVRGEYEVLDSQGEKEVLKKGKRSPKQKAHNANAKAVNTGLDDEDDFELV